MTIKILVTSFAAGKHMIENEIHDVEHAIASALIRAGQAIEHKLEAVEGAVAADVEIAAIKVEEKAEESAPLPPASATSSTPDVLAEGRAADIAADEAKIESIESK